MIIDDDRDVTMALHMTLEQNGFKTHSYTDPVEAYKNFSGPHSATLTTQESYIPTTPSLEELQHKKLSGG